MDEEIMETVIIKDLYTFKIDITYQDTDVAGVVYFANYLNYAERARSKLVKGLFGKVKLNKDENWAIRDLNIRYLNPVFIDETLVITTSIKELRKASIVFLQEFFVNDVMVATSEVTLLNIGRDLKPSKFTKETQNKFETINKGVI